MNIKSLLLGSAAALAACVSFAHASPVANLPIPDNPTTVYEAPFPGAAIGTAMGGHQTVLAPQAIALGGTKVVTPQATASNEVGVITSDPGPKIDKLAEGDGGMKKPVHPTKADPWELAALPEGGLTITAYPNGWGETKYPVGWNKS